MSSDPKKHVRWEDKGVKKLRSAWGTTKDFFRPAFTPRNRTLGPFMGVLFLYTGYLAIDHAKNWNFGRPNKDREEAGWKWRFGVPHTETHLGRAGDFMDNWDEVPEAPEE